MTVYADVLVLTNFIVDYFLLLATSRIIKRAPKLYRLLIASAVAALSSLMIFLPEQSAIAELTLRVALSVVICLVCFGYISAKNLIITSLLFCAVTFCFAGAMLGIHYLFDTFRVAINNSVVYFDISPVYLICFSVVGFLIFSVISSLMASRTSSAKKCYVTLIFCGRKGDFQAIIDSGNSLCDPIDGKAVVIADKKHADKCFGELKPEFYNERYRAVPCSTVSGTDILDGYRCDCGRIITENKTYELNRPVMAISKTALKDFQAIVNPLDCV